MLTEPLRLPPTGVTIAIASWNHELLLPRAVASALAAVRALAAAAIPGELLILDDRSRDGSATLLRQLEALYYAQGLRLHLGAVRQGAGAQRNLALAQATYRYLVYLDGDNELTPEALPILHRAMVDTGAAMVYGNLIAYRPEGALLMNNESVQGRLFSEPYLDTCALWDRLQVADAGSFVAGEAVPEDMELILHLVASGRRLVFVPVVLGRHYQYRGSWMSMLAQENPGYVPQIQRVFDQLGWRREQPANSLFLRYHPDLGYM